MVLAADYPFLDVMWSMLVFFLWVIWIWMMIAILSDVFRRQDLSGWGKAGWSLFLICLPFLGAFIYLIKHGDGMAARNLNEAVARQEQFDDYARSVAGGPANEIEKAHKLLAAKTITQAEFDDIKRRALA